MKYTAAAALLLAAVAQAQNSTSSGNNSYTEGLVQALNGAGLTTLTTVLGAFPQIGETLQQGNYTVFAPNNDALAPLIAQGASALSSAESILMYHVGVGSYPASAFGNGTNHTLIPSALQEPLLGNNRTAPLVVSYGMDGSVRVRTAAQNVTVLNSTTYQNLIIHTVNEVIDIPQNLTATLSALNLTQLTGALSAVSQEIPRMLDNTSRLTVFAPVNEAFADIASTISTLNTSTIQNVLLNHLINGSVVYSTDIMENTTAISAAGEELRFMINNSTGEVMIMSGNVSARIVRTDIPTTNGVMHLIGSVLANTESDPQAAMSAASSYAEAATAAPSATRGVGANSNDKKGAASYGKVVAGSGIAGVIAAAFALLV